MIQFLKEKFSDQENLIDEFLLPGNVLKRLEDDISEDVKKRFVSNFLDKLVADGILTPEQRAYPPDTNAWSVDFPSWFGPVDSNKGRRFFVIGSEPHIHFPFLQSVYQLNGATTKSQSHEMLSFLWELLSFDGQDFDDFLSEIYLTDLIPAAPMRGSGTPLGSSDSLTAFFQPVGNWTEWRNKYASQNLADEIAAVRPELILTQGKDVLEIVMNALSVQGPIEMHRIESVNGRAQNIRVVDWNGYKIVSVPHVGTRRHKAFYRANIGALRVQLANLLPSET